MHSRVIEIADRTGVTASNDAADGTLRRVGLPNGDPGFANAVIIATETVNGSTLDVKVQDSLDGSASGTWFDWITFTQLSGSGGEVKTATREPLPFVRVHDTVSAGGGTWAYTVSISQRRFQP